MWQKSKLWLASKIFLTIAAGVLFSSCASLQEVEWDQLNHPAMDLKQTQTPKLGTPLTSLNSFRDSATSGGCSACAH